jgi:hypothetical protein
LVFEVMCVAKSQAKRLTDLSEEEGCFPRHGRQLKQRCTNGDVYVRVVSVGVDPSTDECVENGGVAERVCEDIVLQ